MGFHLELFIDPVDESLKCDLCHSVYRDPVITSCDHVYCEQCLKEWLVNRTECPKSCKQISFERDVTRLFPLQILVEKLRTHCVNFTEGCEVVTTLSEMLAHLEVCDYTKKDIGVTRKTCSSEQLSAPEVNSLNQVFVCNKGCGLPLLFQDSTEHDCVKSLQAQVSSLQTKLTRSEHEREKVAARLVKREEAMQERFTQLERDLRSYQEQTLNYELHSRDQRSQINYLKKQLDSRGSDQVSFYSLLFKLLSLLYSLQWTHNLTNAVSIAFLPKFCSMYSSSWDGNKASKIYRIHNLCRIYTKQQLVFGHEYFYPWPMLRSMN